MLKGYNIKNYVILYCINNTRQFKDSSLKIIYDIILDN